MRIKANDTIIMILGVLLMGIGINLFFDPANMVTGGVTGIAIIIKGLTKGIIRGGIPLWFTNLFINVFLFLGSYRILGREFLKKTIFATVMFSVALYIIPEIDMTHGDYLLAAVFGGFFSGIGLGLVFSVSSSTGGTDVLGAIVHRYLRHYTVAQIIMVIDGLVVIGGAIAYGIEVTLYAVIAVYITSKMMDAILEGLKFAKLAFVISEQYDSIAETIMSEMRRGVTALPARGMYSNAEKQMLICAVSKKEITTIMDIVSKNDPKAFMIVTDAREVLGEGFIEYRQ
ncbi:YitT family protein [Velocimicrobium porci]|uniref:YitT family protein n=1 Tax=Velocimicrobium porci TaxID=2606634 RepID=A0A6L5Y0X3_9FIRM|nr:YitT family protein [Velocimicrobium porci]MSS64790.1 YitT family protein [Velocimicrobium porci]